MKVYGMSNELINISYQSTQFSAQELLTSEASPSLRQLCTSHCFLQNAYPTSPKPIHFPSLDRITTPSPLIRLPLRIHIKNLHLRPRLRKPHSIAHLRSQRLTTITFSSTHNQPLHLLPLLTHLFLII